MSGILRWEDPPPARFGASDRAMKYAPIAEALKAEPKRWAVIEESENDSVYSLVPYIKQGKGPFGPAGAFEARSSISPSKRYPRTVTIYARHIGEVAT